MSSVLFIAPADLGEAVLATGALSHVLAEGDELQVFCAPQAQGLFRALPHRRHVTSPAPGYELAAWIGLAWPRLGRPFDLMLDLRGSPASYAIQARRTIRRREPKTLQHLVDEFSALVGAEQALEPRVWLDEGARNAAAAVVGDAAPLLALAPGGASARKRWPTERFAAVARRLLGGPLAGGRVALLGARPRDGALIADIATSLAADGVPSLQIERSDLLASAALLERATLCIGNDNVLTHLSAAMNTPTLTLFGPTDERVRAPYGKRARTLRGREYEAIVGLPALDGGSQLEDISVDAVEAAAQDLLRAGGLL